jgi:ABC-type polysaccharide/polyol phosphate export permease
MGAGRQKSGSSSGQDRGPDPVTESGLGRYHYRGSVRQAPWRRSAAAHMEEAVVIGKATHGRAAPVYDSAAFKLPLVHELREVLRYRSLIRNLVIRDLKVRYKRSFLGFIWVMLSPFLQMIVIYAVFSQLFKSTISHFAVYLLAGILMFNMFSQGTSAAMSNLQSNAATLRKLYVPPSVFVASAIGSALVNFVFALGPLILLTLANGVLPSASWPLALVPMLLTTMLALGVGLIVGALFVFFHDIFEIYQVLLNVFYFLTPIMYPVSKLPQPLADWEVYNPMYLFLTMFRNAIMGIAPMPLWEMLIGAGMAVGTLLLGWIIFTRVEEKFVYHI